MRILLLLIGLISSCLALGQGVLLQAKRYLDIDSGQYISPAHILIEDNTIKAINPQKLPSNVKVINKPNLTLLPGLMDMHVHIVFDFKPNYMLDYVQTDAATATIRGVINAKKLLLAGFTTVRDLGQIYPGITFIDVALAKASEKKLIAAPHIIAAGHALSITGGHMDPAMLGHYKPGILQSDYRNGVADGVDEVVKAVRYQIKNGATVIKASATAGVLTMEGSVGAQQYSYQELKAIVDEAKRHGVYVAVHAHGTDGINDAIRAGVRSIEHGSLLNDESIRLMKQHGTFLVPTTHVGDAIDKDKLPAKIRQKAENIVPLAQANLRKAIKANVKIALGTDTPIFPHGQNAKELSALVKRGMSPLQALQAATIVAAEMMDLNDRGRIKQGMLADIIGVEGDPLQQIDVMQQVRFVMKSGTVYK